MIRCLIIDDEPSAVEILTRHIARCPMLELAGAAGDGSQGLQLVNALKPDLVFLDIQLQELNGLDVSRWIDGMSKVIFCTAYSDYAVANYEHNAIDYLLKPIEFDRFCIAVNKATNAIRENDRTPPITDDFLFVKAGTRGKRIRVDLADVSYIEARNNYVAFHASSGKVLAHLSLKEVEFKLPTTEFMRVQKSYIVALRQVASLENNELILKRTGTRIPISGAYKELFLERMKTNVV